MFRLFDSSKYLTTLRWNISPCQKGETLVLIPLYNPSFHLWKSSKKSLDTATILSYNSCPRRSLDRINLHFVALYTRWLIKKGKKSEKISRFLVGMENFTFRDMHVGEKSMRKCAKIGCITPKYPELNEQAMDWFSQQRDQIFHL